MSLPRLALAVIGDEIGPSLPEMISFCQEHGIRRLDMRTVDGRSLLGMKIDEVHEISRALEKAGIEVPTFVSPLLKWPAEDQPTITGKVDFAFDPKTCPSEDPVGYAFDVAIVLGARRVRAFSYLRYPGFVPEDLESDIGKLMAPAALFDIAVELENEPVCNIGSIAELARFFAGLEERPDQLKPLVDIGNSWSMGAPPSDADIAVLAPLVDLIHLKDRDLVAKRAVPLGDGSVPWAEELQRLLSQVKEPEILASLEIHCFDDGRNAVARSLANLRRIAGEIGAEIV